jgi:radical SAM superfamily enzyme YgiQ (UPF0313 family)
MRVLLIRPNSGIQAVTFPLGLGYIADAARAAGHEVSLLDARLLRLPAEEAARRALALAPDAVGVTGIHPEKAGVMELCAALRAAGLRAPVVLGGPLVATAGAELVGGGAAEAAIAGEGEAAFVAWLEALSGGRSPAEVPALIYRANGELRRNPPGPLLDDLDDRRPAWDLIDPPRYWSAFGRSTLNMLRRSRKSAAVFTSRGCPFGCLYCHNTFGRRFRPRSPESVLDEMRMLRERYGVREIEIVDDAFNVDLPRAKEIARRLAAEPARFHLSFSNGLRADYMDEELVDLLAAAGTYRINYAVETASPRLQKLIHKNLDLEKTERIIAHTAGRGIFTFGYFMLGFPTETEDELRATIAFALRSRLHAAGFFYVNPFPGTELARRYPPPALPPESRDRHDYTRMMVNMSEVSDECLLKTARQAYRRFHFAPGRMWRTFKVVPKNLRTAWSVLVVAILSLRDFRDF